MRATAQAVFMAGVLAGSYGFGWFSDKWGRKPSFFLSVSQQLSTVSTFTALFCRWCSWRSSVSCRASSTTTGHS